MPSLTRIETAKVVLVEDHEMFREQLAQLIGKLGPFQICGQANNIKSAMELIQWERPDIAIVDISLRGSSGLELVKDLKAQRLDVPVLMLSMHAEALYAERAIRAGAKGYVSKHEGTEKLLEAIQCVLDGGVYLSEKMTSRVLGNLSGPAQLGALGGMELLSDRELEVFQMLGQGFNTRQIAHSINLGETTVDTYRTRIRLKLQLRNAAELYNRATQWVRSEEEAESASAAVFGITG